MISKHKCIFVSFFLLSVVSCGNEKANEKPQIPNQKQHIPAEQANLNRISGVVSFFPEKNTNFITGIKFAESAKALKSVYFQDGIIVSKSELNNDKDSCFTLASEEIMKGQIYNLETIQVIGDKKFQSLFFKWIGEDGLRNNLFCSSGVDRESFKLNDFKAIVGDHISLILDQTKYEAAILEILQTFPLLPRSPISKSDDVMVAGLNYGDSRSWLLQTTVDLDKASPLVIQENSPLATTGNFDLRFFIHDNKFVSIEELKLIDEPEFCTIQALPLLDNPKLFTKGAVYSVDFSGGGRMGEMFSVGNMVFDRLLEIGLKLSLENETFGLQLNVESKQDFGKFKHEMSILCFRKSTQGWTFADFDNVVGNVLRIIEF